LIRSLSAAVVVAVLSSFLDAVVVGVVVVGTIAFITGIAKEGYDEDNDGAAAAGEGDPKVNPVKAPPPPPDEDDANFTLENALLLAGAAGFDVEFEATAGDLTRKRRRKKC
jgi:hypothetical protein